MRHYYLSGFFPNHNIYMDSPVSVDKGRLTALIIGSVKMAWAKSVSLPESEPLVILCIFEIDRGENEKTQIEWVIGEEE